MRPRFLIELTAELVVVFLIRAKLEIRQNRGDRFAPVAARTVELVVGDVLVEVGGRRDRPSVFVEVGGRRRRPSFDFRAFELFSNHRELSARKFRLVASGHSSNELKRKF